MSQYTYLKYNYVALCPEVTIYKYLFCLIAHLIVPTIKVNTLETEGYGFIIKYTHFSANLEFNVEPRNFSIRPPVDEVTCWLG